MQRNDKINGEKLNIGSDKPTTGGTSSVTKKYWRVGTKEGNTVEFLPVFEVNPETQEVEAKQVEIRTKDSKGVEIVSTLNWLDIYMFVYFACNEELRRNLALRYEKQVNYIPYDVTLQATEEEKKTGIVKRRVELPVDELTMAIARDEAFRMLMRKGIQDPRSFRYHPKKK